MATTQGSRKDRKEQAPIGSHIRIGVGRVDDQPTRCKATHDVPWSERCILPPWHDELQHEDKKGNRW